MITRIGLLLSLTWIMQLTAPWFEVFGHEFAGRDLILLVGGLFLVAKSTHEIHDKLEGPAEATANRRASSFGGVLVTIMLLDIVFSLDSVITAVGMANHVAIMIAAIMIAVIFMMFFSGYISRFVDQHPTIKMLALSFLVVDWCDVSGGSVWSAHIERLHLFRDGIFGICGDVEFAYTENHATGAAP